MAITRWPFLVVVLLFTSSVLAVYYQALHDFGLPRLYSRRLGNARELRPDSFLFSGLARRDDCDPADNTDCPGMPKTYALFFSQFAD